MISQQLGNPLVRAAVRTVLTGGALVAAFGVANAQQAATSPTNTPQANTQTNSQTSTQTGPQQLLAQATVPSPASGGAALQLQQVVVTGSRIATPNQTSISPVQFVTSQQFSQIGATRIEDVLNRLPQVFADQNSTSINGGTGTETVDLRGLGAQRTLVLIDGQRLPYGGPGGGGSDLNMVPTALIENVQILTGGASSIYGADAVAGVVNFKLMDNFQGVKLVANGGGYFHQNNNDQGVETALNDFNASGLGSFTPAPSSAATGAQKQLTFIAGMNTPDNKGNATFYASYRNIAKATQSLYSYSACSLASGYLPGPRNPNGPGSGTGKFACSGSLTSYPGTFLFFGKGTTYENTVGPHGAVLPISAEPRFNYGPLNYMQAPEETWNAGAFLHYTFNEHAEVYSNLMFMQNHNDLQIAYSGDFGTASNVNCANPYLSGAQVNLWCDGSTAPINGQPAFVNENFTGPTTFPDGFTYCADGKTDCSRSIEILRRDVEGQDRVLDITHMDWRLVLGMKGAISDNWTYDLSYQYALVNVDSESLNDMSSTKENYALDVVEGSSGPECAVTAAGNTTGLAAGCVPWNLFTPGGVSKAAVNYLETPALDHGQVVQQIIDTNFTGDLSQYVQLPTAHSGLELALGTEYRDIDSSDQPDAEEATGDLSGSGGPTNPVFGAIESFDEYIEARLPIIQDEPFAKSLATDDSFRHSSYATG
ncbi:MAG: TonB-dependent receptor plug domain-containing protein, partial [Steroidobacteraceae bacterium]